MSESAGPAGERAGTIAAIMAAVRAYLDQETQAAEGERRAGLSRWELAPWAVMRGQEWAGPWGIRGQEDVLWT